MLAMVARICSPVTWDLAWRLQLFWQLAWGRAYQTNGSVALP